MAEIMIPRPNRHQFLIPELEPTEPSADFSGAAISTFLRGPMYPVYAELRDWKLRMKKAGLSPSTPVPLQAKRTAATGPTATRSAPDFRKDGTKSRPFPAPETHPPPPQNLEMKRAGSLSSGKGEEKRGGGGPPRGGSGRIDEFLMTRNFSSYQETTTRSKEEARGGRAPGKGLFGKTFTGFRRPAAKGSG